MPVEALSGCTVKVRAGAPRGKRRDGQERHLACHARMIHDLPRWTPPSSSPINLGAHLICRSPRAGSDGNGGARNSWDGVYEDQDRGRPSATKTRGRGCGRLLSSRQAKSPISPVQSSPVQSPTRSLAGSLASLAGERRRRVCCFSVDHFLPSFLSSITTHWPGKRLRHATLTHIYSYSQRDGKSILPSSD